MKWVFFLASNCPDHIERIKEFGYTESEARFLCIVAVHSGYFTLGQFRAFTGTAYGKRPTSFAQKVLKRGHATIRDYMRRGSIFHLFSRTIYGQIDKDNLRILSWRNICGSGAGRRPTRRIRISFFRPLRRAAVFRCPLPYSLPIICGRQRKLRECRFEDGQRFGLHNLRHSLEQLACEQGEGRTEDGAGNPASFENPDDAKSLHPGRQR